jgi:hypothetical protein
MILISPFLCIFDKLIRFQFLVFSSPLLWIKLMHCIKNNFAHTPEGDMIAKQRIASVFTVS